MPTTPLTDQRGDLKIDQATLQILLRDDAPGSFAETLSLLHRLRFTGKVTLNFYSGTATSLDVPGEPTIIRFDKKP